MSGSAVDSRCRGCGSEARGRVCHFCGMVVGRIESPEAEAEAIHELHVAITASSDDAVRARLLANGPLPGDRDVLIDAALRATQLLDPKNYGQDTPNAAVRRVEAVCTKLRILAAGDEIARRGVEQLEKRVAEYRAHVDKEQSEGGKAAFMLFGMALVLLGGVGWVIWKIVH